MFCIYLKMKQSKLTRPTSEAPRNLPQPTPRLPGIIAAGDVSSSDSHSTWYDKLSLNDLFSPHGCAATQELMRHLLSKVDALTAKVVDMDKSLKLMGSTLEKRVPVFDGQLVGKFPVKTVEAFHEVNAFITEHQLKGQLVTTIIYVCYFFRWMPFSPLAAVLFPTALVVVWTFCSAKNFFRLCRGRRVGTGTAVSSHPQATKGPWKVRVDLIKHIIFRIPHKKGKLPAVWRRKSSRI